MEVQKTPLGGSKSKLDIVADPTEVEKALTEGIAIFLDRVDAAQIEEGEDLLEGLSRRFGEDHAQRALADAAINFLLPEALAAAELIPACSPQPLDPAVPEQGKGYAFAVEVYHRPMLELSSYEPVSISIAKERMTEKDIDDQLLMVSRRAARMQDDPATGEPMLITPAINDAWVAEEYPSAEVNTVQELRHQMRQIGQMRLDAEFEKAKLNAAIAEMAKRLVGEVPEDIVEVLAADLEAQIEEDIIAQGQMLDVVLKEQGISRAEFAAGIHRQAAETLREGLTMDAVFRHAELDLTDEDIEETIQAIAATAAPEEQLETAAHLRELGRVPALVEVAQRMKAGGWILEHAEVSETA